MLADSSVTVFALSTDPGTAMDFYRNKLGCDLVSDCEKVTVFRSGTTFIRVAKVESVDRPPSPFGWEVTDIYGTVAKLKENGVQFDRPDGFPLDENDVFTSKQGNKVAWFKDPEGLQLTLSQNQTNN